jgi:thymidine kinase
MAKLYFYYSAMNAGKSTVLLQSSHNYNERGMDTLLYTPSIDTRFGQGMISSRIGLNAKAISFKHDFNLFAHAKEQVANNPNIKCILVDEAQFLTKDQARQLTEIVDQINIPVLAYGLRSDFRGEPFEGSMYLLIWADNLVELKTICHCGKKAMMNARLDDHGNVIKTGDQIQIGGNERYIAMCRGHFNLELVSEQSAAPVREMS